MKKRTIIQTIRDGAGTVYHIPPRKVHSHDHNLVMRFVIPGVIPSKKNCQVPTINKKRMEAILNRNLGQILTKETIEQVLAIKPYIRSSTRYKAWEAPVREDLVLQAARHKTAYAKHKLAFPVTRATITIYHYWQDNAERDNSNKAESIHDTLVACGILLSDRHQVLYKHSSEADVYSGELNDHLTIFTITAHSW